jgi:hypothetical protein
MDAQLAESRMDSQAVLPEQIELAIGRRLRATGYPVLRTIEVAYRDGVVVLRGRVPTYYCKQLAQSTLLADPLVEKILNLIEVCSGIAIEGP